MNIQYFDPFRNRLCRDIRNDLSEALPQCLAEGRLDRVYIIAEHYLNQLPGAICTAYIKARLKGYAEVLECMQAGPKDVLWQGFVLWDAGLLFEVHEILEHAWLRSQGPEKLLFQALIRAAGVFLKRECGFAEAAAKMAGKALPVLEAQRDRLAEYIDPERLISALQQPQGEPPVLLH